MKKNDFLLIGIILLLAAAVLGYHYLKGEDKDAKVVVTVDGKQYGTYGLSANQTIDIDGTNTLKIQDGKADMIHANCPDQICVHQKAISRDGESIICLPNKVVVTIRGGKERKLDAVAN